MGYKNIIFGLVIVLVIGYVTYFHNYAYPPNLFWDENYHIASAYKYIHHQFFMEPHPPLGKLFIAWGEQLLNPNKGVDTSVLSSTDYIKDIPKGFSFVGVRFFPALFGWLSAPLFFLILYALFPHLIVSLFFSGLYLFDNAMIVHSRGAMLDSTGMFFTLLTLFCFVVLYKQKKLPVVRYGLLGLCTGLALSVKLNAVVLGMLLFFLLVKEVKQEHKRLLTALSLRIIIYVLTVSVVLSGIYYLHISNGGFVSNGNYYEASEKLKSLLVSKKYALPENFIPQFIEHVRFIPHYEKGVPKLDVCKPDENGSYPLVWPFGNKSINYRWEKMGEKTAYLYLQSNPVIWLVGLVGVLLSLILVCARIVFRLPLKNQKLFTWILLVTSLYVVYMTLTLSVSRVLYLYHYFTPLVFSFILAYLQMVYIGEEQLKKHKKKIYALLIALFLCIISAYLFYAPFTYYQPLSFAEFQQRNWFPFWQMKAIQ